MADQTMQHNSEGFPSCSMQPLRTLPRVTILIAIFFGSFLISSNLWANNDKTPTKADLIKLKQSVVSAQKKLRRFQGEENQLIKSLRQNETSIGKLAVKIQQTQTQLQNQQKQLNSLKADRAALKQSKKSQEALIGKHIAAAYKLGRQKKLKVLLDQEKPDALSRAMTYYDYVNKARTAEITAFETTLAKLERIEPEILDAKRKLEQDKQQLQKEHASLKEKQKSRKTTLAKIKRSIVGTNNKINQLERDQKKLTALLAAVEETIANIKIPSDYKPFKALKGKLPWPINGNIAHRFGQQRADTPIRSQGVTMTGKMGAQVKAIHHGRVVFSDWFVGKGLLTIIDHGNGYMSLYAHNQSLLKETGEWVSTGEPIATVGNSGGLSFTGLYFEIRAKGKPSNPVKWCKKG